MTHIEEKNQSTETHQKWTTETHQKWTQMLELADKVTQAVVLTVFHMIRNREQRDMLDRDTEGIKKTHFLPLEIKTTIYKTKNIILNEINSILNTAREKTCEFKVQLNLFKRKHMGGKKLKKKNSIWMRCMAISSSLICM